MKKRPHPLLYLLGKILGQPLAWVLRKQKFIINWLVTKGFSSAFAKRLLICINLFILISILFVILPHWVIVGAIILVLLSFAGGMDIDSSSSESESEWRMGWDGYGEYDNHDIRIDGGNMNDDNTSINDR